jgi:hypothetical protein
MMLHPLSSAHLPSPLLPFTHSMLLIVLIHSQEAFSSRSLVYTKHEKVTGYGHPRRAFSDYGPLSSSTADMRVNQ